MERIDAHQHFWRYDPRREDWITPEMQLIRRDFMPADLAPVIDAAGVSGTVLVQSASEESENDFYMAQAAAHGFIRGVVAWTDLQAAGLEDRLGYYQQIPVIKGFRHVLQGEADRALMLRPAFKDGIRLLGRYGFSYDILIFPDQLAYAARLTREFPDQRFVIDHLAKPGIKNGDTEAWARDLAAFKDQSHVFCKVSGLVTEADWSGWTEAGLSPYLDKALEIFGPGRLMFGSDWPVCLLASSYARWVNLLETYFNRCSEAERAAFWGGNAKFFYRLG